MLESRPLEGPSVCPNCGRDQEPEWRRCPFCGTSPESWPSGFQKNLLRVFVALTLVFMGVLGSCLTGIYFQNLSLEKNLWILGIGAGICALIFDRLVFRTPKSEIKLRKKGHLGDQKE